MKPLLESPITSFTGKWCVFSNFYVRPGGTVSVESQFQAAKTLDKEEAFLITRMSPSEAKRAGRRVDLRPNWEEIKFTIMADLLRHKFWPIENPRLALRESGNRLIVEGNKWHDNEWGNCYCGRLACSQYGKNYLGIMLMTIREAIK